MHEDDLRTMAYTPIDAAGLRRGRLTGLALRGEGLGCAGQFARQISLDRTREDRPFAGLDRMKAAYAHAIAAGYRFYSYGDACLLHRSDQA